MTWGIYVHVPWCRGICPYCGFFVRRDEAAPFLSYVDAALKQFEAASVAFDGPPASIYLGGGTPSLLPATELKRLLAALPRAASIETEANPEDIAGWLDGALDAGVTRVSLGVQSLQPKLAKRLGRAHTAAVARDAMAALVAARADGRLRSWSADLIFGVPGQTMQTLDADLDALLEAGAPHISLYGLTFEPRTPFDRARQAGRMTPLDDDLWRGMYDHLVKRLGAEGLRRYEVSNFARPGHESAHNQLYWTDAPYLGLGPAAHGYLPTGQRTEGVHDIAAWLADPVASTSSEQPDAEQAAVDLLISGMRIPEGVRIEQLVASTGLRPARAVVTALQDAGLLVRSPDVLALSDAGFPVSDGVIARLATQLEPQ